MNIDTFTFNKARLHPLIPGQLRGYDIRSAILSSYKSIIGHTTNGAVGTSFEHEADFLVNANLVSAHYLIGKNGRIAQILDPRKYTAWHTGHTRAIKYVNPYAIGIEMHNTPAEGHCTALQLAAFDWLVRKLITDYNIDYHLVETHRFIAVPAGRKIDPSGFPDEEFYAWRDTLAPQQTITYRVINSKGVNVRQSPQVNNHNIAGVLQYNDIFESDVLKNDELGQYINGTNKWAHLLHGMSQGDIVDGLGFVHLSNLRRL